MHTAAFRRFVPSSRRGTIITDLNDRREKFDLNFANAKEHCAKESKLIRSIRKSCAFNYLISCITLVSRDYVGTIAEVSFRQRIAK